MPKSQVRKKKVYTPPTDVRPAATAATQKPSPVWLPVTAVALIVFGIALAGGLLPLRAAVPGRGLGYWNLAVGFGCMVASLAILVALAVTPARQGWSSGAQRISSPLPDG